MTVSLSPRRCWKPALIGAFAVLGSMSVSARPATGQQEGSLPVTAAAHAPDARSRGGVTLIGTVTPDLVTLAASREGDYVISDPAGVTAMAPCVSDSATMATCPRLGPKAYVNLSAGDNRLVAESGINAGVIEVVAGNGNDVVHVHATARAFVLPGLGRDTVFGGPGDDVVNDGAGADHFYGRGGHDFIRGGIGRDVLTGGAGPDRIHADNHDPDRQIKCGGDPGDKAIVDPSLDPPTIGCRKVQSE